MPAKPHAKLYIEYRVEFPTDSNGDIIHEMAEDVKDKLYDIFGDESEIKCIDVSYDVVMFVPESVQ